MPSHDDIFSHQDESMVTTIKTVHHNEFHAKEVRQKRRMAEKRGPSPIEEVSRIPYINESKKLVDSLPRVEREQQTEINRRWYSPANCNCCWSEKNHWYRRHHRVLRKKGDNKDNKPGHVRSVLIRPPSYISKYSIRQDIAEGLQDYEYE